jgi:hypothetical protein
MDWMHSQWKGNLNGKDWYTCFLPLVSRCSTTPKVSQPHLPLLFPAELPHSLSASQPARNLPHLQREKKLKHQHRVPWKQHTISVKVISKSLLQISARCPIILWVSYTSWLFTIFCWPFCQACPNNEICIFTVAKSLQNFYEYVANHTWKGASAAQPTEPACSSPACLWPYPPHQYDI